MTPDDIEIKRMYSADDRRSMAKSGDAMPDGSFPIADEEDLQNAIAAFGRAKDKAAAKEHIMRRAEELDAMDMIPANWAEDGSEADDEEKSMADEWGGKNVVPDGDVDGIIAEGTPEDEDEDEDEDEKGWLFRMPRPRRRRRWKSLDDSEEWDEDELDGKAVVKVGSDGEVMKCAKGLAGDACGYSPGDKVCGKCGAMAVETKSDDLEDDLDDLDFEFSDDIEDAEIGRLQIDDADERAHLRRNLLEEIGVKSAEVSGGAFRCMMEQKVFGGETAPCADCTGGCVVTDGLPDLAEIEAVAEQLFGKVLDSGYSDAVDRFLVTVERKDGLYQAFFDGMGNFKALTVIDEAAVGPVITADEAIAAAMNQVEGEALVIDAAVLEGHEVYSVEIDGVDGKAYDVYVDPSTGDVLAYDVYEYSADEVDAATGISEKALPDSEFVASMMEFELLEAEQETGADPDPS